MCHFFVIRILNWLNFANFAIFYTPIWNKSVAWKNLKTLKGGMALRLMHSPRYTNVVNCEEKMVNLAFRMKAAIFALCEELKSFL